MASAVAADFVRAVPVPFVDQSALHGHIFAAGYGNGSLDEEINFIPGQGLAVVDDDHVTGGSVGEQSPFHGRGLHVDDDGHKHGRHGADAATMRFFAEAQNFLVAQLAVGAFHRLAKSILHEGGKFVGGFLRFDPFHGQFSPRDGVGVEVGNKHGPLARNRLGIGRSPLAFEKHVVFVAVVDALFAHLASVVSTGFDGLELRFLRQILKFFAFVNHVFPLQRLHVVAVGAGHEVFFHGAGETLLPCLVAFELGLAESEKFAVGLLFQARAHGIGGIALMLHRWVSVELIENPDAEHFVSPRSFGIGPEHVDEHPAQEESHVAERVFLFADSFEQVVLGDPWLESRLADFPRFFSGVDAIPDVGRPVHDVPANHDKAGHGETDLRGLTDEQLAFARRAKPIHDFAHVGRVVGAPALTGFLGVLGTLGNDQGSLGPLPNGFFW